MGKTRVGKLMQLFGASIDAMARAQDTGQDPFAALDADVGWDILLGKRDEIAGFGELATSDPLSLAAERYAYGKADTQDSRSLCEVLAEPCTGTS